MSFKEKIIHKHTIVLLRADIKCCFVYDSANLLNRFKLPRCSPSMFSFTPFTEHVILLTLSFPLFQVKSYPLLRGVVIYSANRLLGGSLYSIVSTRLRLLRCYIFFRLLYWYYFSTV